MLLLNLVGFFFDGVIVQVFIQHIVADTLELVARQQCQQTPAQIQRFLDGTVGLISLRYIVLLKCVGKSGVFFINIGQRRVAENDSEFLASLPRE